MTVIFAGPDFLAGMADDDGGLGTLDPGGLGGLARGAVGGFGIQGGEFALKDRTCVRFAGGTEGIGLQLVLGGDEQVFPVLVRAGIFGQLIRALRWRARGRCLFPL